MWPRTACIIGASMKYSALQVTTKDGLVEHDQAEEAYTVLFLQYWLSFIKDRESVSVTA